MKKLKLFLEDHSAHCESRKGTQKQAIDYVIKQESKAGEPVYFGEKKQQGKRSDIDAIWDDIKEGDTLREILFNHGGNAVRIIHAVEKATQVFWGLNKTDIFINNYKKYLENECEEIAKIEPKDLFLL